MYSSLQRDLILLLIFSVALFSCTSSNNEGININLQGDFSQAALENTSVFSVSLAGNGVLAGTNKGIFRNERATSNSPWISLGLASDTTRVVDVIAWDSREIMVAIQYNEFSTANDVLRKTEDGGQSWMSFTDNFIGENINNVLRRLAIDPGDEDELFALGGLPVARSADRGQSWKAVFETWQLGAFGNFITIDSNNPDTIWSGGQTNIFSPSLVKSTDGGDNWERLTVIENVETAVYDLVISSQNSDHLIAGLSGGVAPAKVIRKSTDGGQSWNTVMEGNDILALAQSPQDGRVVYAAGATPEGTLSFFASGNFGDTWQQVSLQDSPTNIFVNDIVVVQEGESDILYLGTNKGVYSYTITDLIE